MSEHTAKAAWPEGEVWWAAEKHERVTVKCSRCQDGYFVGRGDERITCPDCDGEGDTVVQGKATKGVAGPGRIVALVGSGSKPDYVFGVVHSAHNGRAYPSVVYTTIDECSDACARANSQGESEPE